MPFNPRPRVLCVDDDEDSRVMLSTLLRFSLIEAKTVGTAAEALSSIQAERFNLYLLDAWLPDLDGFELCRRMRAFDPHTPILFFSGAAFDADKERAIEAGADAYVIKPDVDGLVGSIKQFVFPAESNTAQVIRTGHEVEERRNAMAKDDRAILDLLKDELAFIEQGGYGRSVRTPWLPSLPFRTP